MGEILKNSVNMEEEISLMVSEKASCKVFIRPFVFLHKSSYDTASKWGLERQLGPRSN